MIKYDFTPDGVAAFLDAVWGDIFHTLETDGPMSDLDIFVTVGNREIRIPANAVAFEALETFLVESRDNE